MFEAGLAKFFSAVFRLTGADDHLDVHLLENLDVEGRIVCNNLRFACGSIARQEFGINGTSERQKFVGDHPRQVAMCSFAKVFVPVNKEMSYVLERLWFNSSAVESATRVLKIVRHECVLADLGDL